MESSQFILHDRQTFQSLSYLKFNCRMIKSNCPLPILTVLIKGMPLFRFKVNPLSVRLKVRKRLYKYTGSRLQRVRSKRAPSYSEQYFLYIKLIDSNVKKFGYNKHPLITNRFFSIFLLVVSGI